MSTSARRWFDRGLIVSGTSRAGTPTSWSSPGHGDPTHVGLSRYSGSAVPRQLAQRAAHAGHWLQLVDETRPGDRSNPGLCCAVVTTRKRAAQKGKPRRRKTAGASEKRSARKSPGAARDDFPLPALKHLAAEVGYLCSNPTCCAPTIGPSKQRGISNVGVGAHITAAASGGPRFDKRLTRAQRISAENGIWMCHRCGRLV